MQEGNVFSCVCVSVYVPVNMINLEYINLGLGFFKCR